MMPETFAGLRLVPSLILAAVLVVLGVALALWGQKEARRALGSDRMQARIKNLPGAKSAAAGLVFWGTLFLTAAAVLEVLHLGALARPFSEVLAYLPRILGAGVIAALAWGLAWGCRSLTRKACGKWLPPGDFMSRWGPEVIFFLVLFLFLPPIFETLGLLSLLAPLQGLLSGVLEMLPRLFWASLILFLGFWAARLSVAWVTRLMASTPVDTLAQMAGTGMISWARAAGLAAEIAVFFLFALAALNILAWEALLLPVTGVLTSVLSALPRLLAAGLILAAGWGLGRLVFVLGKNFLVRQNFDAFIRGLGVQTTFFAKVSPSVAAARLAESFVLLFAASEAAAKAGLFQVSWWLGAVIVFLAQLLFGALVLFFALLLGQWAFVALDRSALGRAAQGVILALVGTMGLRAMGVAQDIVALAFGLLLGSVAVAVALAFGLGGREAAGKQLEYWFSRLRRESPAAEPRQRSARTTRKSSEDTRP